ncbi:hypothetical protein [Streptomyces sp. NPDC000229]|uniref:hypothetical protein n=1 Tax=Streptomyces sp. NPDC000229 TaxID=3154247 RepID=UPI00331C17AF
MGVSIEVMVVDWERVEAAPPDEREELLIDAAFGDEDYGDGLLEEGWIPPTAVGAGWCVRYSFRRTLDSYKPHFWAGERWERVRDFAHPGLRTALDRFTARLFWHGLEYVAGEDAGVLAVPEGAWDAHLLLWCPPGDVAVLEGQWAEALPDLDSLREPFTRHAAGPQGWIPDFESFADLLKGWGEVVREAHRRGWDIVGLRC